MQVRLLGALEVGAASAQGIEICAAAFVAGDAGRATDVGTARLPGVRAARDRFARERILVAGALIAEVREDIDIANAIALHDCGLEPCRQQRFEEGTAAHALPPAALGEHVSGASGTSRWLSQEEPAVTASSCWGTGATAVRDGDLDAEQALHSGALAGCRSLGSNTAGASSRLPLADVAAARHDERAAAELRTIALDAAGGADAGPTTSSAAVSQGPTCGLRT